MLKRAFKSQCLEIHFFKSSFSWMYECWGIPVIDAQKSLFTRQENVGYRKRDIHHILTLTDTLSLKLIHLLWVCWDYHLRPRQRTSQIQEWQKDRRAERSGRTSSVSNIVRLEEKGELFFSRSSQGFSRDMEPSPISLFTPSLTPVLTESTPSFTRIWIL